MKKLRVALVHDYLPYYGGAELVLSELHQLFPNAPIYTILVDKKGMGRFWKLFEDADIRTSWFNKIPFASRLISPLRFLIPVIWNSFDFSEYDLVITSASWAVTKGMKNAKKEICYLHTPPRYLYGYETSRDWENKWFASLVRIYAAIVNHFMRLYDFKQAQKVDYFIANSKNVGERIKKFYRRADYTVIYPPVEVDEIISSKAVPEKGDYFLAGGRLVASKNFDLIIKACAKLGVKLKIFGIGIESENLEKLRTKNVEFLGQVSEERLISLYKGARAFILAERQGDFGITPVEASAAGNPVVAYRAGGYLETVKEGVTGIFFDSLDTNSMVQAIGESGKMKWDKKKIQLWARKFSKERFRKEVKEFVNKINDKRSS